MKIASFDKQVAKKVGEDAVKLLTEYAKGLGLSVQNKGGTFDAGTFTMKVGFALLEKDGKPYDSVLERAVEDFRQNAELFDLKTSDLGVTVSFRDESYKIIGLSTKNKFPILVERVGDGKRLCLRSEDVVQKLHPENWRTVARPTASVA